MTGHRLRPPEGGDEAPRVSSPLAGGAALDLVGLATDICERYRLEFPDERERYGDAGIAWCVHDNQHLLNWATESVNGELDIRQEVAWLATVLQARDFPLDRLARDLDIAADVVLGRVGGPGGKELVAVLTATASRRPRPYAPPSSRASAASREIASAASYRRIRASCAAVTSTPPRTSTTTTMNSPRTSTEIDP